MVKIEQSTEVHAVVDKVGHVTGRAALSTPPTETELKLLAPTGTLTSLRNAPVIQHYSRNKGVTRLLETTYYDTPERTLQQRGLALRVRRNGKKYTQTLKTLPGENPLTRYEWETPVDSMEPNLALLADAKSDIPFAKLAEQVLQPIFISKIRRQLQMLELPDALIEVSFDEGTIEAGDKCDPVCEVELELKRGNAGRLYEIGLSLLDVAPVCIGTQSKSERGYALALDVVPVVHKAVSPDMDQSADVDEGIARLLANCYRQLISNIAAAGSGRNPDGVHQMRVALRRLRTVYSVLRHEVPSASIHGLADDARSLAQTLGNARNWDVFVTTTLAKIEKADLPNVDVGVLKDGADALRSHSHAVLQDTLASPATNRFFLALGQLIECRTWRKDIPKDMLPVLDEPISDLASRALARIHRKALKRGKHFGKLEAETRHQLRLSLKKLRYAGEFFALLYKDQDKAETYLKRLSKLQDVLGVDNDITTANSLLHHIEENNESASLHRAIGAVVGWQGYHRVETAKLLRERWRKFKKASPFWT